jgi:RND family efflux transporter MFP subunit
MVEPKTRRLRRLGCRLLVGAVAAGAFAALAPAPARAQGATPPVTVGRAERAPVIEEIPVTGTVASPRISRVSSEVSGRVAEVRVEVGDRVEADALLARLDAELANLDLRRARAARREGEAALADARRRLADAERLSAKDALAESALLTLRAEVEMDEATLARLRAEEGRQAALLARHEVRAPFAGAISRKLANGGEWIEPGTPLVELVSVGELRIDFQVPQEYYPRVEPGSEVEVALDAVPERRLVGRVVATVPRTDPDARTFLMLVRLDDAEVAMVPGMSARTQLRLGSGREGVVVPRDALLRHPDGRVTVWVLDGDADGDTPTVSERRVRPGRAFDGRVEILEGLEAGRSVVLRGNEGLQEGQRVRVRREPADV